MERRNVFRVGETVESRPNWGCSKFICLYRTGNLVDDNWQN
jgi:hypothetical protein